MNGIVLLDKPLGITSFEAVRSVSRIFGREKAGHSGTLDPAATGVLPVFLGRAAKLISLLPDRDKSYVARVRLGISTDTGDAEGKETGRSDFLPGPEQIRSALPAFTGEILQTPPMYSAKKRDGVPLYELARRGETVERKPCRVFIRSLEAGDFAEDSFTLKVSCSEGTYVRTLAEDIAAACGALCHLTALRRTSACGFPEEDCVTLDRLRLLAEQGRQEEAVLGCDAAFPGLEAVTLPDDLARLMLHGFRFPASRAGLEGAPGTRYRIHDRNGRLTAICGINGDLDLLKLWQAEITP